LTSVSASLPRSRCAGGSSRVRRSNRSSPRCSHDEERVRHRCPNSLGGAGHNDGLMLRSHMRFPPLVVVVGYGFQQRISRALFSCFVRTMIRWETLESNFQKWQSYHHARLDDVLTFVKVDGRRTTPQIGRSPTVASPDKHPSRRIESMGHFSSAPALRHMHQLLPESCFGWGIHGYNLGSPLVSCPIN
jgi:hypothetical protein